MIINTASTSSSAEMARGFLPRIKDVLLFVKDLEFWRLFVVFVSGLTTLIGMTLLYDTFGSDHGNALIGSLRYVIPPALAGSLHAIIYWALERGSNLRSYKHILLALPFQVLAILASYGAHWVHMRGDSYTVGDYDKSQTAIVRGIRASHQSYQTMATATEALAAHSVIQAKNEADGPGNSCGMTAGTGRGPRYELRMSDRATFFSFNADVAKRLKQFDTLVERTEKLVARSAEEAMQQRAELRSIVNEVRTLESDPLLSQLRQATQQRLQKGRGAIEIPAHQRAKKGPASFTCPDPMLERHLSAVIDAIAALKPVPEVEFKDARDPRVGAMLALERLVNWTFGKQLVVLTREEQREARRQQLRGRSDTPDRITSDDLGPLVVAIAIEGFLTLLFLCGGGALPNHPGLIALEDVISKRRRKIFDRVWTALGGDEQRGAVRRAIAKYTKYEGNSALVVVPIYAADTDVQTLHQLMTILAHVRLAKRVYTGRYMARLYTFGWTNLHRANALNHGAVQFYRMSSVDCLALTLDAVHGAGESLGDPQPEAKRLSVDPRITSGRASDTKKAA